MGESKLKLLQFARVFLLTIGVSLFIWNPLNKDYTLCMKSKLLILLTTLFILVACNFQSKKTYTEEIKKPQLPPLDSVVINYQDKQPFDTVFHLTGEKVPLSDSLLKDAICISFQDNHVVLHEDFQIEPKKFPVGSNEFICFKDSSIVRTTNYKDSVVNKEIHHLTMHPTIYLNSGTLMVDTSQNRMVFAYTFYRVIQVMDLEAKAVKTLDFEGGNHNKKFAFVMDGPNPNTIYYIDSFAGEDYFYLLYWGNSYKKLIDNAYKGWRKADDGKYEKTQNYQQNMPNIVEQYDWNGNPVGRYLLEGEPVRNVGRFVVDEKGKRFYLLASECYGFNHYLYPSNIMWHESLIAYSF